MVSSLSSRLLAKKGDCPSRDSSKGNASTQQPRTGVDSMAVKNLGANEKNGSSMSGYSADREGPSAAYPPVVSINLHSKSKSSLRGDVLKCPKRRKKNEMQFVATTVEADLARAGKPFKLFDRNVDSLTVLKDHNLILKDHVRLVYSKDVKDDIVSPTNIAETTTEFDYAAVFQAVTEFYPSKPSQMSDIEQALPAGQNTWSDPSTSSVSDTLSDSGSDNTNNSLPPLLEDGLDIDSKRLNKKQKRSKAMVDPSRIISSESGPISMSEILQLSKTARVVTESSAPFSVIYANAAFHSLAGKKKKVIGDSLLSMLDTKANSLENNELSLEEYMNYSGQTGEHKLWLLPKASKAGAPSKPVKCTVRVSPVLDPYNGRANIIEPYHVEYFVIEFVADGKEFDDTSITRRSSVSFSEANSHMGVVA